MQIRCYGATIAVLAGTILLAPGCLDPLGNTSHDPIGAPCTPDQEDETTFNGFDEKEVTVETSSLNCVTRLCLVNHFRGRVSCPYGQSPEGAPPPGASPCTTPNKSATITGDPSDAHRRALVAPQCIDRSAERAVYCSCRCANDQARDDDGAKYCTCPDGYQCSALVSSIGKSNAGLAGSYCVKRETTYDANSACNAGDCDPAIQKCK